VHIRHNKGMKAKDVRPTTGIRIKPDILYQARVAAVTQKKTLGQWLEEAIVEKIQREQKEGR
jgi:predicted HicB family RNase H-like nuclease